MGNTYFFTGFPGFIAGRLIRHLLLQEPQAHFELLVHPDQMERARREVGWLVHNGYGREHQFVLIRGDICEPDLGISESELADIRDKITYVFHLAAIYDLAVPEDIAYRVNVQGTKHVSEWVLQLPRLRRYVYFSTAYVSGLRTGWIKEDELEHQQLFKNHYESTKYEAERCVQRMFKRVPVTIIRPGVVVGDSQTGETVKFDGPYFILRFLDRFRHLPIPYIGRSHVPINLVPIDYIVKATVFLSQIDTAAGKVYHLTDPSPYPVREVYEKMCEELLNKKPGWTIPKSVVAALLSLPFFRRWVGVEKETLDYFSCEAFYDNSRAQQDLSGSGIACPDLMDYLPQIIEYYKLHRRDQEKIIPV